MVATTLTGQGLQEELYGPLIEKTQFEFMRYQSTTTLSVFLDSPFDIDVIGLTSLSWAVLHTLCMYRVGPGPSNALAVDWGNQRSSILEPLGPSTSSDTQYVRLGKHQGIVKVVLLGKACANSC